MLVTIIGVRNPTRTDISLAIPTIISAIPIVGPCVLSIKLFLQNIYFNSLVVATSKIPLWLNEVPHISLVSIFLPLYFNGTLLILSRK